MFSPSDIPAREQVDVSQYPEDTREAIATFSELWRITPPEARQKPKSFWIQAARDLNESCGNIPVRQVLRALFADWNALLHKGQAYTVTDPNSLVKMARAKAGAMRSQGAVKDLPSPEIVWEQVRDRLLGGSIRVDVVAERAVNALGGWEYLGELQIDVARLVFQGKYRELATKAAVGLLSSRMEA